MPFSSEVFLYLFLPTVLLFYFFFLKEYRNFCLLLFSLLFYIWGAPGFLPILLVVGALNYLGSRFFDKTDPIRKFIFVGLIILNVITLLYFKYSNFFVHEFNMMLSKLGFKSHLPWSMVALPIGISFLTFEQISYISDVYSKKSAPAKSLHDYLLFLMLFPHSIAGPIFRWQDLEHQMHQRFENMNSLKMGSFRFIQGLSKKILIADPLSILADYSFSNVSAIPFWIGWLGIFAYSFQIYYDFSGYSDMAIGLGKVFGFEFKENFKLPYDSKNFTEFWKKWHISLSTWMRDYLYIPLGGNQKGKFRTLSNILIVFVLSGFWHGASWTFILWGLYHGTWIIIERQSNWIVWIQHKGHFPSAMITFVLVSLGWVFFRSENFLNSVDYFKVLFFLADQNPLQAPIASFFPNRVQFTLTMCFLIWLLKNILFVDVFQILLDQLEKNQVLFTLLILTVLLLSLSSLTNSAFNPFIYFKF